MEKERVNEKAGYVRPDFEVMGLLEEDVLAQISGVFQPDKDWENDDWFNQP